MSVVTSKVNKPIPVWQEGVGLAALSSTGKAVTGLTAYGHPDGGRIDLKWTNPVGVTNVQIRRKRQCFPYDLSDQSDTAYNSAVVISSFSDNRLLEGTYYYYLIAVSYDNGVTWYFENCSRVFQLSLTPGDSGDWLWNRAKVPQLYKIADQDSGLLRRVVNVLGAGIDLFRSRIQAITLLNDPDESPLSYVFYQVASLGFEPEMAFDFNTSRRALAHLVSVLREKGSIPGLLDFIKFFVQWQAKIIEFGIGIYSTVFQTWGGEPNEADSNNGATITYSNGLLTDSAKTWTVDQWANGLVMDAIGNEIPVMNNTATALTLGPPNDLGQLSAAILAGVTAIPVVSLAGWAPGMTVQIYDPSNGDTEDSIVYSITVGTLHIIAPTVNPYTLGSHVYNIPKLPQMEQVSSGTRVLSTGFNDPNAMWDTNQWLGYKFLDSGNVIRTVQSNNATRLILDTVPITGTYSLAYGFVTGGSFAARTVLPWYKVKSGQHSELYEPLKRRALRGTAFDPFQYLYGGTSIILSPALGLGDVGIFIQPGIAQAVGQSTAFSDAVLTDTVQLVGPPNNTFQGMWLNPNRNQTKLFLITASDGTVGTVTTAGGMTGFAGVGNNYFILTQRDAIKYSRLVARVSEFMPFDAKSHIYFQ